jgi:hypothetical protein
MRLVRCTLVSLFAAFALQAQDEVKPASDRDEAVAPVAAPAAAVEVIRSAHAGPWSDPATWEGGKAPRAGVSVLICTGHDVVYDLDSDQAIRAVYISGKLRFTPDKNTRLDTGLLKLIDGNDTSELGFDCHGPAQPKPDPNRPRPVLEVGTPERPIDAAHNALIRLVYFDGMDPKSFPAVVCCGGQMDFHGTEMNRTWLKLGADAKKDSADVVLSEPVTGWRKGDTVIVTGMVRQNKIAKTFVFPPGSVRDRTQTEERTIAAIDGAKLTLDKPLAFDHLGSGEFRNEVANLSRNVVVESADPAKQRGHTMYHRHSKGSISYAEFRHLGKAGVLGRYSLHFHLVGETMRGSYVIGASIWDSGNRWLTIHGTNFLVVRDCVGYNSIGHGFFLEDGTEQYNVLDRNLAVQAKHGEELPSQVLPFDHNSGGGFWWGNCLNTFTRNVAAECDEYGFRFDMQKTATFDPVMSVEGPDGKSVNVDVRTQPYVRFEDNESHCQRRHSYNLGGYGAKDQGVSNAESMTKYGVAGVGPDQKHPMIIRNCRSWNTHWAFHTLSPYVMVDHFDVFNAEYGLWFTPWTKHAYRGMHLTEVKEANFPGKDKRDGGLPPEDGFPNGLNPVDDLPPQTVITQVFHGESGKLRVRGVASDNGEIKQVTVNGQPAKALRPNFAEWEIVCDDPRPAGASLTASSEDAAGNVEKIPHVLPLPAGK